MASLSARGSIFDSIPAADPPPGERSNLVDPPSLISAIVLVNSIFLICMLFMVICRFWVRGWITRNMRWDDWTCGLAGLGSISHSSLILYDLNLKLGVHIWNIPASIFINSMNVKLLTSVSLIYPIAIYFVKLSLLLLYQRIFGTKRSFRAVTLMGITFITAFYTSYLFLQIVTVSQCTSILTANRSDICTKAYAINIFESSLNVATDFFVLLLPIPSLLRLQLDKRRRIGLIAITVVGATVCLISIARLVLLAKTLQFNDPWYSGLASILSVIEINTGIIIASAPMLPRLFPTKSHKRPTITTAFNNRQSHHPFQSQSISLSQSKHKSTPTPKTLSPLSPTFTHLNADTITSTESTFRPDLPPKDTRYTSSTSPTSPASKRGFAQLPLPPPTQPSNPPGAAAAVELCSRAVENLARTISPDRERYMELEDPTSPAGPAVSAGPSGVLGRVELPADGQQRGSVHEMDGSSVPFAVPSPV